MCSLEPAGPCVLTMPGWTLPQGQPPWDHIRPCSEGRETLFSAAADQTSPLARGVSV